MYNKDICAMSSSLNIRAQSLCLLYISQQNVDNCSGNPCWHLGKYLLSLVTLYLPVNKYLKVFKKSLFTIMPAVCNSHTNEKRCWKKMLNWLTSQSLLYGFLLRARKRWGNLTHSLLLYIFQFSPCEIQHSTFRRKNAGYFSEGSCEPRPHRPAEAHPVPALTILHSALEWDSSGWTTSPACLCDPKPHHIHQYHCLSCWAVSDKVPRKDWLFF